MKSRPPMERLPLKALSASSDDEAAPRPTDDPESASATERTAVVALFWLLGVGSLWSWNAFITPTDFYKAAMPRVAFLPLLTSSFTCVGLAVTVALQPLQGLCLPLFAAVANSLCVGAGARRVRAHSCVRTHGASCVNPRPRSLLSLSLSFSFTLTLTLTLTLSTLVTLTPRAGGPI
jgi:hypothetical protein